MSTDPATSSIAKLDHAGYLQDLLDTPAYLDPEHRPGLPQRGQISCSYCGVGDSGTFERTPEGSAAHQDGPPAGPATLCISVGDLPLHLPAQIDKAGLLHVRTARALVSAGGQLAGRVEVGGQGYPFEGQELGWSHDDAGESSPVQSFRPYRHKLQVFKEAIRETQPTGGCVKLLLSTMRQRTAYPIHLTPSILDRTTGQRVPIRYREAIARLGDQLLSFRPPYGRTLVYASGQIDYFTVFAIQEVFRLLGTRNLTGNAEHCLNAGAIHNEILTGQEGPFLTIDQAITGPDRFYLFNSWNGFISHPPVFRAITARPDLDAFLVEVVVSESAKIVAKHCGKERILLVRPRSDPHLALAVAHQILTRHPEAVHERFLERFADASSFERFCTLAASSSYSPERVAERIAPEPQYVERLLHGIRLIARKMAQPDLIPINIPSVGLSQTSGVVAHCLWGNVMALVGKYGLSADGTPAGGTLRLPGQINAETEVQGLSRKYFMGRIPMDAAADAALRMGLPEDAYAPVLRDTPRAALDYSEPTAERELFLCLGTQFEANMMGRKRWIKKLQEPNNSLIVIDPIPDPFTEAHAELIIPSPPHPATPKLYQNGEWKLSLSTPQKRAAPETRSDATLLYDTMAEITRRLLTQPELAARHPDLAQHAASGYLQRRFCPPAAGAAAGAGLSRFEGEVSRPELWARIQAYMSGGCGPLYCRPEHEDGRPIAWSELMERGSIYYGGIGTTRYRLDYDNPAAQPFGDIYRRPGKFRFFTPTDADLQLPEGILFNTGRSSLSDDRDRVVFAAATFNSGKATPTVNMPDEHPLHVSPSLAARCGLKTGDRARVIGRQSGDAIELPVVVTDRVKGETVYVSFHKSRAQMERGLYVNDVTSHEGRCVYSAQTSMKATSVALERVQPEAEARPPIQDIQGGAPPPRPEMTLLDPILALPVWTGQGTSLRVTDILQETHDVYTFRFQGDPLCRFVYNPGQFCSLVLNIDGQKVVRSYSISSSPTRPLLLEITIKRVPGGRVSNFLPDSLRVGDPVELSGPKGKFCLVPGKIPPKLLFLAAGSGITPLMSMARWLCDVSADVDVVFFNAVRSRDDIIFEQELLMMTSRYRQFAPIQISVTRKGGRSSKTGLSGRINRKMLERVAPDLHDRQVYLCGPEGFMATAKGLLEELGFPMAHFHVESFGGVRTSTENKSLPHAVRPSASASPQGLAAPAGEGGFTVEFARAGKRTAAGRILPLLDLAESLDIDLKYGCRAGSCGDCKVKLLYGEVEMSVDDSLSAEEKKAGYVLSCTATPRSSCVVDA